MMKVETELMDFVSNIQTEDLSGNNEYFEDKIKSFVLFEARNLSARE